MSIPAILPKTMRVWTIDAHGGLEQMRLRELHVPMPKPRDVLIRMHFAEVGDWDILVREGTRSMKRPFPLIIGLAGTGTVAAIGSDVKDFAEIDVVYSCSYSLCGTSSATSLVGIHRIADSIGWNKADRHHRKLTREF